MKYGRRRIPKIPAVIIGICGALLSCTSVRDETASAIELYTTGYGYYQKLCISSTKTDREWCRGFFHALQDTRDALKMMAESLKIGGNMKYQRRNLKDQVHTLQGFIDASPDRLVARSARVSRWSRPPSTNTGGAWCITEYPRRSNKQSTGTAASLREFFTTNFPNRPYTPWLI